MTTYTELLGAFVPDFYWFRNAHWMNDDVATITGTVLLNGGQSRHDLVASIDSVEVDYTLKESAYANDKFWFLPEQQRFDIEFRGLVPPEAQTFIVSVLPAGAPADGGLGHTFVQYPSWKDMDATPPTGNIERVSGKGATNYSYHNNGATDHRRFDAIATRYGVDPGSARVLDWGCGCGRLTRHFMLAGSRISGIDIDSENIAWCQQNLDPDAFYVTGLFPPTRFADHTFDLVIANSVLSHLTLDAAKQWLQELHRIIKPGGLALLSYHGEFSLAGVCSKTEAFVRKVVDSGFDAGIKAQEVNDVISDPDYYRHTFMTDDFSRHLFAEHFDVEGTMTGVVSRFQNLAILRR